MIGCGQRSWKPGAVSVLVRALALLAGLMLAGLTLAGLPLAAAGSGYVIQSTWPKPNDHAADYGYIDITGIAVGQDGRIYACQGEPSRHKLLVFAPDGTFLTSWNTGTLLEEPHSVRVDPDGNVWVADVHTHQIYKFSPDGQYLGALGERNRPGRTGALLSGPNDLAFAPSGDIYVAEGDGDDVVRFSRDGQLIQRWGRRGSRPGQFRFNHSIAVDAQNRVYVADRKNKRIQVFTADGQFLAQWKRIGVPFSLWITPDQRLFMADGHYGKITVFTLDGQPLLRFGKSGRRPGTLTEPHMLAVDNEGVIYVADASGKRITRIDPK